MKLGTTSWLTGGDFLADARLVAGRVDFVELLVYTWDREMQARVAASLDALAALDLEYTTCPPTARPAPWPRPASSRRAVFPCST